MREREREKKKRVEREREKVGNEVERLSAVTLCTQTVHADKRLIKSVHLSQHLVDVCNLHNSRRNNNTNNNNNYKQNCCSSSNSDNYLPVIDWRKHSSV